MVVYRQLPLSTRIARRVQRRAPALGAESGSWLGALGDVIARH